MANPDLSIIIVTWNTADITLKCIHTINKYLNNKLNYEILDISKRISGISKHYKCKFIFIEDLEFKGESKGEGKGKAFNRLNKNLWKRNIFIQKFK